jgi:hypothetical protein
MIIVFFEAHIFSISVTIYIFIHVVDLTHFLGS